MDAVEKKFWDRVVKTRTCWLWKGPVNGKGRPMFWCTRKPMYAHRYAYEKFVGPLGKGLFVCHDCDNKLCVRPSHLFLGTQDDNMKDMVAKGRQHHPVGETNPKAKLTAKDVKFIRDNYKRRGGKYSQKGLAQTFGVSVTQIQTILYRKQWTHV